ncbi:MAG: hypothetical protein HKN49_12530, partial [Gammaproteobacteria bacterium]|nr:hypothetical protein [Gammaproteobacteria bacterium]
MSHSRDKQNTSELQMVEQNDIAEARYVSRFTRETMALVLAGGQGSRLFELTEWRAKPAL